MGDAVAGAGIAGCPGSGGASPYTYDEPPNALMSLGVKSKPEK
jgi:hypothetical protein